MAERDRVTETRSVDAFKGIKLRGVGHLFIKQGKECSLEIKAPPALLRKIKTNVNRDVLDIGYKFTFFGWLQSIADWRGVEFFITTSDVEEIVSLGVGEISTDGTIKGDALKIISSGAGKTTLDVEYKSLDTEINGTGHVLLSGSAEKQRAVLNGAGKLEAFDLSTKNAKIKSRGSGQCFIMVTESLDVNISGVGKVKYKGSPQVKSSITGLGKLESSS